MTFNAEKVTRKLIKWIQDWFEENGRGCNAVIGISGGKDSTVVAGLCAAALGRDRVIGVSMPNGVQPDISDADAVFEHLGIRKIVVNIKDSVDGLVSALKDAGIEEMNRQATVNLPPRIRMSTLYAVSQNFNGRVVNTCNLSEDWVGYSTRYGDSAGDFAPLGGLTVEEVRLVGMELGLPEYLVYKVPSDGLSGLTDEDNLGFTYAVLDKYIRTGECEDEEVKAKIDRLHALNAFKLKPLPFFKPNAR